MPRRVRLLKLDEISLVDTPAQEPAVVRLTKRALEDAPAARKAEETLDALDLQVLKAEAAVESIWSATSPEEVWQEIERAALAKRLPGESKEAAVARYVEENPHEYERYRKALNPPVEARRRYLEALFDDELRPVADALGDVTKALEVWPDFYRFREEALSNPERYEEYEKGHTLRKGLATDAVLIARATVAKAEGEASLEEMLKTTLARPAIRAALQV